MYGADGSVLHVVGPGEGWTGLSKAYGTSPHRLRELNPWMRQPRPGTAVLVHPGAQHAPAPPSHAPHASAPPHRLPKMATHPKRATAR